MKVAVLGAGIMGSGIAQISAMAGYTTAVYDLGTTQLDKARVAIDRSLSRLVTSRRLGDDDAQASVARLDFGTRLPDALSDADVVIEAAPEILSLKQELLCDAAKISPPGALLGTNTSQLSITRIGAALPTGAAERLIGTHFFNPPVMMRLVELVRGLATAEETLRRAEEFAHRLGKETVVCRKDSPGFITTRISALLRLECVRMLEEGIASAEDIDRALRLAFNHPMGPLELGDFNGLDTFMNASSALEQIHGERFRPPVHLRNLVAAGRLGRKTGRGFYDYDADGNRKDEP